MTAAVDVRGIGRDYGGRRGAPLVTALHTIDLQIGDGEVHGLLGPNGAGKTTLCKILSTVLMPSRGTASVAGFDVVEQTWQVRNNVGIVFGGERGLYTRITARQNLEFWAALYRMSRRDGERRVVDLLERVGLRDRADERVETFSRGMKQRLHLARGLMGDPRVLILDEPTTGMDPVAAKDFRVLVGELRGEGRAVLVTTHDMAEAEAICDRVSLIDGGRLLATERPATLGSWISRFARVLAHEVAPERIASLTTSLEALEGVTRVTRTEPTTLRVDTAAEGAAPTVIRHLLDAGVLDVTTARPDLAEVYLHVIGDRGMRLGS